MWRSFAPPASGLEKIGTLGLTHVKILCMHASCCLRMCRGATSVPSFVSMFDLWIVIVLSQPTFRGVTQAAVDLRHIPISPEMTANFTQPSPNETAIFCT